MTVRPALLALQLRRQIPKYLLDLLFAVAEKHSVLHWDALRIDLHNRACAIRLHRQNHSVADIGERYFSLHVQFEMIVVAKSDPVVLGMPLRNSTIGGLVDGLGLR